MKNFLIVLLVSISLQSFGQSIYLSSPGLKGETTTGIHANEVPLEAFDMSWQYSNSNIIRIYTIDIKKRLNKSSVEFMRRFNNFTTHDYVIKFYDDQDVNYYTISLKDGQVTKNGSHEGFNHIRSPECSTGNCSNHYEEFKLKVYFNFSNGCSRCAGEVTFKHELTGETETFK